MGQDMSKLKRNSALNSLLRTLKLRPGLPDVNAILQTDSHESVTPLCFAVRYGDTELANILLHSGARVNLPCGDLNKTPLHIAAYNHDATMVEFLLTAGGCPDVIDQWNYTPLMYAAIHNEPDAVELLFSAFLSAGANVNFGATLEPLYSGCENEQSVPSNTDSLDINACFEDIYITYVREPLGVVSGTALHMAVQNPHLPSDVVELLLKAGADANAQNLYGQTPLVGAMLDIYYDYHSNIQGHTDLLLKYGADVNISDIRGWTPFHYAAQRGSATSIRRLLKAGADANRVSHTGETPLWVLLAKGWQDTAKYLLQNGCDINQPIHSEALIRLNNKIDLCRHGYILPLEFAICNKFYDVADLLLCCGCYVTDHTWTGDVSKPEVLDSRHAQLLSRIAEIKSRGIKSLAMCCKDAVRAFLRQGIVVKLESVALPETLRNYICLK